MSSYLFVAFPCRGTLFEIQSFQDGIFAETPFDGQLCLLQLALFIQSRIFLLTLPLLRFIVCEKIQLLHVNMGALKIFVHHISHRNVEVTDQQVWIYDTVEKFRYLVKNHSR